MQSTGRPARQPASGPSREQVVLISLLVAAGLVYVYWHDPAQAGSYPSCPFYALTGMYCPGCGSLRALHQLLHGHPLRALDLNPLLALSLPFVAYSLGRWALEGFGFRVPRPLFIPSRWIWALFVLICAHWVLRNLPWYPFTVLAP